MSFSKRQWERQAQEGWRTAGNKFVCSKCFEGVDVTIQEFIKDSVSARRCSYCKRFGRNPIAAEMDEVLSFIAQGIHREYESPDNQVGRDRESESGYDIPPTSSYELLGELGFGECLETLFADLCGAFSDSHWVQKDPYGSLPCDSLRFSWDEFSEQLKHKIRFMFFKTQSREDYEWEPEPWEILDSLGKIVEELNLIELVPKGLALVRARQHDGSVQIKTVSEIGPPLPQMASQSRMSPAGIPMFYGATDSDTAFREVLELSTGKDYVTFGHFKSIRSLHILDLTRLPQIPSLFDEKRYQTRMPLIFMHRFIVDAIKPIQRDGREHIEYIPTQVVAEFFRHVFRFVRVGNQQSLDGIKYPSSKTNAGACYTIFCDAKGCSDSSAPPKTGFLTVAPTLELIRIEQKQIRYVPPGYF